MKTDYPELEGKEIKFYTKEIIYTCVVVGVNYHIGITAINKENKNLPLICLINKKHRKKLGYIKYRKLFHLCVKIVQKGEFTKEDHDIWNEIENPSGREPNINDCPWR